jgi:hypothetical protein
MITQTNRFRFANIFYPFFNYSLLICSLRYLLIRNSTIIFSAALDRGIATKTRSSEKIHQSVILSPQARTAINLTKKWWRFLTILNKETAKNHSSSSQCNHRRTKITIFVKDVEANIFILDIVSSSYDGDLV